MEVPNSANSTHSMVLIKRLMRGYLAPHKSKIAFAVLCMVLVSACTAGIAFIVEPMIDKVFIEKNAAMLTLIPMAIIVLFLVKGAASYFQNFFMEYVGQKLVADLQGDLYKRIIHQDLAFFSRNTTSELSSRFLFDLHRLKQAISQTITGSLRDSTSIIGLIAVMFYQSWELALIALVAFPVAAYPIVRFGKRMRKYASSTQEEMGSLATILKESFSHNRQVKIYTMEPYETTRAKNSIGEVFHFMVKAARVRALSSPVMELLGGFSVAFIVYYGGMQVMNGETTAGSFLSFMTALMTLYRPVKGIANINNVLQEGLAAAERTFELMDSAQSLPQTSKGKALKVSKGEIVFDNVSLNYPDGTPAIKNLSLKIPAGKTVAFVGASGAGKSSVLNMIPRFYEATKGKILIDGEDIADASLKSLRQNIALVTQDVAVFDDTAFNNIAYGYPKGMSKATEKEVHAAAKSAAAHEFISKLPQGYETQVGEEGAKLSGGQKQRLTIARAMLKNAPILLLDEATSSLDNESEQKVQNAIGKLRKGRTCLIVAHRLSTIADADEIYVLDKGEIVEKGTHTQLLKKNGTYAKLYRLSEGG